MGAALCLVLPCEKETLALLDFLNVIVVRHARAISF